ncbi:hypothetical protein CYMTET_15257 [Cymbomonas tetramitiformis]|uniref:Uncharacterized protein n=1 Tax=Cymbomonas tetramitiformis TaxID=36881 RepID=A0AAE0L937_9CHLO|nr:hypothetical protein CYMTET_15257 [Cymbomonas tetramitiformis]
MIDLTDYIKVNKLSGLTIVDPLATSPSFVEDFVHALNAKENKTEDNRQFKAEYFKVKGTEQTGRTKNAADFDPVLLEHADRYKRKGISYIFQGRTNARKGRDLFSLPHGERLRPEFDASYSERYKRRLDEYVEKLDEHVE